MWGLSRVIFILFFIFVWEEWRRDWEPANTQWSLSGKETGSKFKDGKSKSTIKYKREKERLSSFSLLCVCMWSEWTRSKLQEFVYSSRATSGILNPMTFPFQHLLGADLLKPSTLSCNLEIYHHGLFLLPPLNKYPISNSKTYFFLIWIYHLMHIVLFYLQSFDILGSSLRWGLYMFNFFVS